MRIYVSSMAHPKRLAKRLAKEIGIPLNRAQVACAAMLGYNDWHELEQVTDKQLSPPSKPDWLVPTEIVNTRRNAFGVRLQRVLEHPMAWDWDTIWALIDTLDPTGTIPDDESFFDARINEIFPACWSLSEEALTFFDDLPSVPFEVSVGQAGSREFEGLLKQTIAKSPKPLSNTFVPEDRFGYRTFIVNFDDREKFQDIQTTSPGVALIPIRFIPTITEGVLLEVELSVHPAALASYHLDDDDTDLIADSIVSYLRDSTIWALSMGTVCGATNGILLTLSGQVSKSPIQRIMVCLSEKLELHSELFDPDEEFDSEQQIYLPIRNFFCELEFSVPEDERKDDYLARHGIEIVEEFVRLNIAMSKMPQVLERILTVRGFSQYAEFCNGMSMNTFAERKKLSAFICSMERAKALPRHLSLFFRHHLVDMMIGQCERAQGITADSLLDESQQVETVTVASMARSLGDEELATLIEQNYESLFPIIRETMIELEDLFDEFAQP